MPGEPLCESCGQPLTPGHAHSQQPWSDAQDGSSSAQLPSSPRWQASDADDVDVDDSDDAGASAPYWPSSQRMISRAGGAPPPPDPAPASPAPTPSPGPYDPYATAPTAQTPPPAPPGPPPYASSSEPGPAPATDQRRGRSNPLVMAGVILLMISIGIAAAVGINRLRAPADVPGAGAGASVSASALAGAAASPSTGPSLAPPGAHTPAASSQPLRSPTASGQAPTEPPPLPDDPVAAFRERMVRGERSYHFEMDAAMEVGNEAIDMEVRFDVDGPDYRGTVRVLQRRVRVTVETIVADGEQYTRAPGGEWERETGPADRMPGDLFSSSAPGEWSALEYVGPERRNGRRVHHLRLPTVDWEGLSEGLLDSTQTGVSIRTLDADLWVTQDGRPHGAEIVFDGTVQEDGVEVDMTLNFVYRFSDFGSDFEIEPPDRFIDPDQPTS